jgi:hypothetical protein
MDEVPCLIEKLREEYGTFQQNTSS